MNIHVRSNREARTLPVCATVTTCLSSHGQSPVNLKGLYVPLTASTDQYVGILKDTIVALVRRDGPDLSSRQLGVFLTCYLKDGAQTVRGLAAELNVSKPAITRALDRLGELDLARRKVDPADRRSVLVQRTLKGQSFLRDLRGIMAEAGASPRKAPADVGQIAAAG